MATQTPYQSDSNTQNDGDDTPSYGENSIEHLRSELQIRLLYINDPELKDAVHEWIQDSHDLPTGSVDDHIESELAALEAEFKMYNHDGVDDGTDAFPDDCKGCPHYGGGCPVVTQKAPQERIKQLAAEADSQAEFKRGIREIASDYECHRIPEWVAQWDDSHQAHAKRGFELYRRIDVDIGKMDSPGAEPKVDPQATGDDADDSGGRR